MSNYACVITKKNTPIPSSFLEKFKKENLIIDDSHPAVIIYFFSKEVRSCLKRSSFFKGYYVDHESRYVGFSQKGDFHGKYFEGCFASMTLSHSNHSLKASTDVFGLMPLLYSFDKDIAILSDSLYFVKKILNATGRNISLDYQSFMARTYISTITAQSLSSSTIATEIKYLVPGSIINIDYRNDIELSVSHIGAKNIFLLEDMDYEEGIRDAADKICGLLGGVVASKTLPCLFDLTGGLDSRLALASVSKFFGTDFISVASQKKAKRDYDVAKSICEEFDLGLNVADKPDISKIEPGSMWLASNAGLYDSLYSVRAQRDSGFRFKVGGHGAEVFKGIYGFKKISEIGKDYSNDEIYSLLQMELNKGLEEFGIDPEDDMGSEWHYVGYRNAIHSSKGTQATDYYLRPLLIKSWVHNMKVQANRDTYKNNPISDMLIYINPQLAMLPFDNSKKNITAVDVERIKTRIGTYSAKKGVYTVDRNVNAVANGYLPEVLSMAARDGFSEAITIENFSPYINNSVLPKGSLSVYSTNYWLDFIFNKEKEGLFNPSHRNVAISKLLSLNLFT
ncbi:hypothetical protein ACTXP0_11665 [Psychrobacter celer]|uniref:hypothetical protein n=1 Tax=Psychrobacter celer TaxID=306572 RepID=UPI003FCF8594